MFKDKILLPFTFIFLASLTYAAAQPDIIKWVSLSSDSRDTRIEKNTAF
jgi:hypothetical protein